jgi:hypothetical protein
MIFAAIVVCSLPSAAVAATPIFESAFGPDGTAASKFTAPGAIGVDESSHDVYVADYGAGTVEKFDEDGTPTNFSALVTNKISNFDFPAGEGLNQIAVNQTSHDFYVLESHGGGASKIKAYHADGTPAKFTAIEGEPTALAGFNEACGLAVDSAGDIYVANFSHPEGVEIFKPDGEPLNSIEAPQPCNLAVDSTGVVYVNHFPELLQGINAFLPSQFPITPATTYSESAANPIDPNATLSLAVDPVSHQLFADEVTEIAQYEDTGLRLPEFGLFTHSEGIAVDGSEHKVYATDLEGNRQVEIFAQLPPVPPTVDSTYFTNATATEADLRAQVNPNGSKVHYRFQYVTQAAFEATGFSGSPETGEGSLPGASTDQIASAHIGGLTPDTTYRFRIVAESEGGSQMSPEPVPALITFATPPAGLPDGRSYEMVTQPKKLGEVLPPEPVNKGSCPIECLPGGNLQLMPMQPTPDGTAVVFTGQPFSGGLAAGPNEYLASRTASGWTTQSISPLLSNKGVNQGYKAFSADLARGVIYQEGRPGISGLSPEAPTDAEGQAFSNLYLRETDGTLVALVREAPPNRSAATFANHFVIFYGGGNAGAGGALPLSHVIFAADDALTAAVPGTAPPAPSQAASERCRFPAEHCNLYEWVESGGLRLVSVLPGNASAASAPVLGGGLLLSGLGQFVHEGPSVQGAVSDDGRRVFWSDEQNGALYVRVEGTQTLEVPSPGKCKQSLPEPPENRLSKSERVCFLAASSDGGTVLLSNGRLDVLNAAGTAYEAGEDLTAGLGGFEGILGAAQDFSRIYYVDIAALTPPGEENENGEHAEAGKFNLYLWEDGTTSFIGTLLDFDNHTGPSSVVMQGDWKVFESGRTAQVSPDGRYLAFMSAAPLTGYDNEVRENGECLGAICNEVFEYDSATGNLTCASCNPTGERPLGDSKLSLISPEKTGFAPLPPLGNLAREGQGRLFFESGDVLSPHDSNGRVVDLYEWEPRGIGSCSRAAGCVNLISSGHGSGDSLFVNSTPSGNDAFFVTRQRLLPQDGDDLLDLYDARTGGGFEGLGTAACGGEGCEAPVTSAPSFLGVGSGSFTGEGNPPQAKHCKKGFIKKQGKCAKKKQHKQHHSQNKRGKRR